MIEWQLDNAASGPRWRGQSVRKDGHRAEFVVYEDGCWFVNDLCDGPAAEAAIAHGRAGSLEGAKLLVRVVWELSA